MNILWGRNTDCSLIHTTAIALVDDSKMRVVGRGSLLSGLDDAFAFFRYMVQYCCCSQKLLIPQIGLLWFYHKQRFKNEDFFFFFFFLFRGLSVANKSYLDWGQIRSVTSCLHHNHTNKHCWILNPLSEAGGKTWNLMVTSRICFCCATTGIPKN